MISKCEKNKSLPNHWFSCW